MDHELVPRPSKRCDWTLKLSWDDLGLHQGKNGRVTMEVEVPKKQYLSPILSIDMEFIKIANKQGTNFFFQIFLEFLEFFCNLIFGKR